MRIKPGGPSRSQRTKGAKKTGKTSGAKFADMVDDEPLDTEERARQLRSQLLDELQGLAEEVENGKATKEEASRRFALMVIRERFGDQSKTKGGQKMEESIGEMVENDPNFVSRLQAQLKKLSKS